LDCRLSAVCSVTLRQPRRHAMLTWITIHCGAPRRLLAEALRRRWKAGAQSSRSGVAPKLIVDVAIHVALPPKADMCAALVHVCFGPKADSCTAARKDRYSITWSARASTAGGTVRPSA